MFACIQLLRRPPAYESPRGRAPFCDVALYRCVRLRTLLYMTPPHSTRRRRRCTTTYPCSSCYYIPNGRSLQLDRNGGWSTVPLPSMVLRMYYFDFRYMYLPFLLYPYVPRDILPIAFVLAFGPSCYLFLLSIYLSLRARDFELWTISASFHLYLYPHTPIHSYIHMFLC
jgi:hypothetical protein